MNYDVAISYASENLERAEQLHEALTGSGINTFFARDAEAEILLWGKNPRKDMPKIYKEARCCVLLLSNHYFVSPWTKLELRSATNALPVVVGTIRDELRTLHDIEWPQGGAAALVPHVREKLKQLENDRLERRQRWQNRLKIGVGALASVGSIIAVTAVANQRTQARLEENTGPIDGHWVDSFGVAWEIEQDGYKIRLYGKAPNGIDISASGSRHGRSIRAEWSSPKGQGAIQAEIAAGGKSILGMASGPYGNFPFNLSR
ncbi:MAG: toll/interleukin-1 receptor domain-containing protein [Cyanobacteria bacterium P01_A01_bin.116]